MNAITRFLAISATVVGTALHVGAFAQSATDTSKMPTTQMSASMTDGEVKKVDQDSGKVTIKHGDIKHLDMPYTSEKVWRAIQGARTAGMGQAADD